MKGKEKVFRITGSGYKILNDCFIDDYVVMSKYLSKFSFLDTYDGFKSGSIVQLPNGDLFLVQTISYSIVSTYHYLSHV